MLYTAFRSARRLRILVYKNSNKLYTASFKRYLLLTNATVTSVLFTGSDFIEQKLFEKPKKLNLRRLAAFTICGFVFGMYGHYWYRIINKIPQFKTFPNRQALLYQIIFSPTEYLLFFTFVGAIEGESAAEIKSEINEKFLLTYALDWMIYYPFIYCNIKFTPLQFRVVVDNAFGFCWTIFLSFIKHHSVDELKQHVNGVAKTNEKSLFES